MGPELRKLVSSPIGAGTLREPTSSAEGSNPVCDDRLSIQLALNAENRISDLAWRATACPACLAVVSCAAKVYRGELLPSGPPFAALRQEVERLGGLSRFEQHGLALIEDVLAKAIASAT